MDWIALLGRLLLVLVFMVAAVGKLADRQGSRQAVVDFGVPKRIAVPTALFLPILELAIVALLIPSASARLGGVAALGLLMVFTTAIALNIARGKNPDCHCFGQLRSAPVGWSTVMRNAILMIVAAAVAWRGGETPSFPSSATGVGLSLSTWVALLIALLALAVAAIGGWFLLHLLPQQGRILLRLEEVEATLGVGPIFGLPVGEPAPEFELRGLDGDTVSLTGLRAPGHPVLLFFMNPDCAPCDALLPDIARWQREYAEWVTVTVISRGSVEANRAKAERHGLQMVLIQKAREVGERYQIDSTPSAVLISAQGEIASQIGYGAESIRERLRQAVNERSDAPAEEVTNDAGDHYQPVPSATPGIGQSAPALVLPDLAGETFDLADARGTSTLILFWSPSCGFCQQMLPELKAWERKRGDGSPRLLVVSSGTVVENRAMGFTSPVVLDADGSVMRRFGAAGTPTAVLVDAGGRIASALATGAREVMALARTRRRALRGMMV